MLVTPSTFLASSLIRSDLLYQADRMIRKPQQGYRHLWFWPLRQNVSFRTVTQQYKRCSWMRKPLVHCTYVAHCLKRKLFNEWIQCTVTSSSFLQGIYWPHTISYRGICWGFLAMPYYMEWKVTIRSSDQFNILRHMLPSRQCLLQGRPCLF